MCITWGEYVYENNNMWYNIVIGYAPTATYTMTDNLQEEKNKQRMRDDVLFVHVCIYYDICERFPTAGNEGEDTTFLGSNFLTDALHKKIKLPR